MVRHGSARDVYLDALPVIVVVVFSLVPVYATYRLGYNPDDSTRHERLRYYRRIDPLCSRFGGHLKVERPI